MINRQLETITVLQVLLDLKNTTTYAAHTQLIKRKHFSLKMMMSLVKTITQESTCVMKTDSPSTMKQSIGGPTKHVKLFVRMIKYILAALMLTQQLNLFGCLWKAKFTIFVWLEIVLLISYHFHGVYLLRWLHLGILIFLILEIQLYSLTI